MGSRTSCRAPPESSHLRRFVRPEFMRAPITQRLMRARVVVPADPAHQLPASVLEADEVVLPDAFLLQASEEALDDAILLGRVGGDELLSQAVIATRRPEAAALIDESPLSERTTGVAPGGRSVPNRARQASSSARSASLARPRRANS